MSLKITFLSRRLDHQLNNNPLIRAISDPNEAYKALFMRQSSVDEDAKWHPNWYVIAHDIETQTEFPQRKGLLLSAFCIDGEHVLVVDNTSVDNTEVFPPGILKQCLFIAHNADFEARWGTATGFLPTRFACTMVNDRRLMSGQEGFRYDLVSTISRRLGPNMVPKWMDKDIRKQFSTCTYFTDEQILYNAADTIRLKSVYYKQREIAAKLDMGFLLGTINSRIIIPIAKAEITGIKHDTEKWKGIARDRQRKAEEICEELTQIMTGQYGVDLEQINPAIKEKREKWERKQERTSKREQKLKETLERLERTGKTHLKSYSTSLHQLQKLKDATTITGSETDNGKDINWGSQKQVLAALKAIGCPLPSAKNAKSRKVQEGLGKEARANWFVNNEGSPFESLIKKFDQYKKLIHNVNSFGETWVVQYLNLFTGRIHTMLDQAGTDTGRFSSGSKGKEKKYPNMQQIPKAEEYRECFIADEGRSIVTLDYKNCEGVIMIAQSGDLNMKKITTLPDQHSYLGTKCWRNVYEKRFEETGDESWLELATTYEMNQSTPEKKKERDIFKNSGGLFPVAYGVYASKVAAAAKVTVDEGQIFIDTIKKEIPLVIKYLDGVSKDAVRDGYALHNKRSGSRRWFQSILDQKHYGWRASKDDVVAIESAARNTVIQGTNSDLVKEAIAWVDCWSRLYKVDVRFLLTVHDEIVVDCPDEIANMVAEKVAEIMRRVAQCYLIPEINMDVDVRIAKHWKK